MLKINIRSVYGENKAYPVNLLAQQFANLVGTKTLTRGALCQILGMGMEIAVVDQFGNVSATFRDSNASHLPAIR